MHGTSTALWIPQVRIWYALLYWCGLRVLKAFKLQLAFCIRSRIWSSWAGCRAFPFTHPGPLKHLCRMSAPGRNVFQDQMGAMLPTSTRANDQMSYLRGARHVPPFPLVCRMPSSEVSKWSQMRRCGSCLPMHCAVGPARWRHSA